MYSGGHGDVHFHVVVPGKDQETGVDNVGTVPAAVATYATIDKLKPDLLINAGTSGGFKVRGNRLCPTFWAFCAFYLDALTEESVSSKHLSSSCPLGRLEVVVLRSGCGGFSG